ncbi:MAG: hypothetical protein ACRDJE_05920 [Dehalococcoidia bacterium]
MDALLSLVLHTGHPAGEHFEAPLLLLPFLPVALIGAVRLVLWWWGDADAPTDDTPK